MSELLNAFNNAWPFVQIFMLATPLGLCALPVWLAQRWLATRHKLPDDVLVALRQNGDLPRQSHLPLALPYPGPCAHDP